jgi:hypothetical protein
MNDKHFAQEVSDKEEWEVKQILMIHQTAYLDSADNSPITKALGLSPGQDKWSIVLITSWT